MREGFRRMAGAITAVVGTPWALMLAIAVVLLWAVTGPVFGFSDTWQLAINTGTTIVTFLMVFVIQASQNRESRATQLKLDELIRAGQESRNELIALEKAPEGKVELHEEHFRELVKAAEAADPDVLDDKPVHVVRPAASLGSAQAPESGPERGPGTGPGPASAPPPAFPAAGMGHGGAQPLR